MSNLSSDQVRAAVHPLDDATVAEIIGTGVNLREFKRACVFYAREKETHAHSEVPTGRIGDVISILERAGARVHDSVFGEGGSTMV